MKQEFVKEAIHLHTSRKHPRAAFAASMHPFLIVHNVRNLVIGSTVSIIGKFLVDVAQTGSDFNAMGNEE